MPGCFIILLLFITLVIGIERRTPPVKPYEVPAGSDIYTVAAGSWDWDGRRKCEENPHVISFSADRDTMFLTFTKPLGDDTSRVTRYVLHEVTRSSIRGRITDETRLTDRGDPMVWDLVLTSPDSYRWRGTEWPAGAYTGAVVRCPGAAPEATASPPSPSARSTAPP